MRSTKECLRGRWAAMATPQPAIGDWYRSSGGALFEVVALDDDDGTIEIQYFDGAVVVVEGDRKSTRLNSSHSSTSYAVFCLKKKKMIAWDWARGTLATNPLE